MRVAVITPYFREPLDQLRRCHESVASQTHADTVHFMVADGHPRAEVDGWPVRHLPLPWNHADFGDTPRAVGAMSASSQGFDAIAFLDADNWYDPQHIETMVGVQAMTNADIVTATRRLIRTDGSVMGVCTQSNGEDFCDMNCFLFTRRTFKAIGLWAFKDSRASAVDDYVLWSLVKQSNARIARSVEPTVNYLTLWALHYLERGEEPPPGARCMLTSPDEPYPKVFDYWKAKGMHERGEPTVA
jgi:glycosyltransferase involved in cell wall biosynthesis